MVLPDTYTTRETIAIKGKIEDLEQQIKTIEDHIVKLKIEMGEPMSELITIGIVSLLLNTSKINTETNKIENGAQDLIPHSS